MGRAIGVHVPYSWQPCSVAHCRPRVPATHAAGHPRCCAALQHTISAAPVPPSPGPLTAAAG
mgnify:CR=1 FL=1